MAHQIIVIHGGDTFNTYEEYLAFLKSFEVDASVFSDNKWKQNLPAALGTDFQVLQPRMPNSFNAKYAEWKIWFEKLVPLFAEEVSLVGHSLGGMFLVKYLSEVALPSRIKGLFLVAACFDDTDEYTVADFKLPDSLAKVTVQCPHICIYHSSDDPVVPVADAQRFAAALPGALVKILNGRGHFNQPDFPELTADLQAFYA